MKKYYLYYKRLNKTLNTTTQWILIAIERQKSRINLQKSRFIKKHGDKCKYIFEIREVTV